MPAAKDRSPLGKRESSHGNSPIARRAPKTPAVKIDSVFSRSSNRDTRSDVFRTGPLDLVTDRVKNVYLGFSIILMFPVVLLNVVLVLRLSSVVDHWQDDLAAQVTVMRTPSDFVLGETSEISLRVLVANKAKLPVNAIVVKTAVESIVPDNDFAFCEDFVVGSYQHRRLSEVCTPLLDGQEVRTDNSGFADFEQLAIVAGAPGNYVLNVTAYTQAEERDDLGQDIVVETPLVSVLVYAHVYRNTDVTITPTRTAPEEVEYGKLFDSTGQTCVAPPNGGESTCSPGSRPDLSPPSATFKYHGNGNMSANTRITFFLVASFSEVLLNSTLVGFPRTRVPHHVGSHHRMADYVHGSDSSTSYLTGVGAMGTVEYPQFVVRGSNNPALFFAFYSCGVFKLWNQHERTSAGVVETQELAMLPPLDLNGLRAAQGEVWRGGNAFAEVGDDGVAAGDQSYLNEVLLTEYPTEIREGDEFELWMDIFTFRYPRGQQRPVYMPNVVAFAEVIPFGAVPGATDAASFRANKKVLLNAVSQVSTEGVAVFPRLAFSVEGEVGTYRIRVYAEGFFHVESLDIRVFSTVNQVRLHLPAHLQMTYPGCNLDLFPEVDENGDGNPDFNYSANALQQAMCIPMIPFQELHQHLPYVEAYVCNVERFLSTNQNCVPMKDKTLTVKAIAWGGAFGRARDGTVLWSHTSEFPNQLEGILSYEWRQNDVDGRYDVTSLAFNNAMHDRFYLTFSVAGVRSSSIIAVELNQTHRVEQAVEFCRYAPVAFIDVLDKTSLPTVAYPSMYLQLRAFAADSVGRPAAGRVLCLTIFELDWHDTFAERVLQLELERRLLRERELSPFTTMENMTYFNKTCFLTGDDGVGTLDFYFDSLELQFREGAFAWYVYSAEFDGGQYYRRFGTRFVLEHEWEAETEARACLASFGYSVPKARTGANYVYLRPHWTPKAPYALLLTARHPRVPPEIGDSRFPQRSSWYGTLKPRWVAVGERAVVFFRLYEGTALTDELVYPADVSMQTHLLSGPDGFPIRGCAAGDLDDVCYTTEQLSFSGSASTDLDGYAFFAFTSAVPGTFRFLLSVGTSDAGGNFFSPVFEIENVPFSAATDCTEAAALLSSPATVLAPQMKYFDTCPSREEDGGCTWAATVCDEASTSNLVLRNDVVPPESESQCIPIGAPFPNRLGFDTVSDLGELLTGVEVSIDGAAGSASMSVSPSTIVDENATITLNYADPGMHQLSYSFKKLSSTFRGNTIVSRTFTVVDQLRASFPPLLQHFVLLGRNLAEPVQANLVLHRRCFFNLSESQSPWRPPTVELIMEPFDAINGSVQNRASSTIVLEGALAVPTLTRPSQARVVFSNLTVTQGLKGTYVFKLRVQGSTIEIATSNPVQLETNAASLLLLDQLPDSVDMSSTLYVRVQTTAASGVRIAKVYVHAVIMPLNETMDDVFGLVADDPRNQTAAFVLRSDVALSDDAGIAHFALNIEMATPGEYTIGFSTPYAPTIWSKGIALLPHFQSVEILAAPIVSNIYSERPVVWPFLRAKAFDVNFTTMARHGPIFESAFSMKGIIVGTDENDVVVRVKDWRGIAVWGLEFDVTLVDVDDNIIDKVSSASRGIELTQDQGLRQVGPSCSAMEEIYDCHGLYAFTVLATENDIRTGFYRFRFEVGGLAVTQEVDVLFRNTYLPNLLYIDVYMLISLASPIVCAILFQINRADKYIYDPHTAKYSHSAVRRLFQSTIPTALVAVFGIANYLFYLDSDQSKTPPYDADGSLIMADFVAKWSVLLLFGFVFSWLFRSLFGELKRGPNKILQMEHFVSKLGLSESIERLRRSFVGKVPRIVAKPPKAGPVTHITNKHLKRLDKIFKFVAMSFTRLLKLVGVLWHFLKVVIKKIEKLYLRIKYSLPMFTSLYQGWPDVHYGQRFLSMIMLTFFVVASALTIGLWFGDRVKGMLSSYYSRYLEILTRHGSSQVDWAAEVSSGAGLNSLEEVTVLFCARTAGRGQEFFNDLLNVVRACSIAATMISTVLFAASIMITMAYTREQLCRMRLGTFSFDVKKLTATDACAFVGTQSVLVGFGWGTMFFTCFALLFVISWGPTRSVFLGTPLLLLILSTFLYGFTYAVARIRVRRNPGMVVVNRAQFALGEFVWWLVNISIGPFVIAVRLTCAMFGHIVTWFWLWINAHEDIKGVGSLGNSMYSSAVYVHHEHNNPIVRAMVERIHLELRNKDTLRLFPNTNTEPAQLLREKKALQAKREKRRTVAKLLVMLQMRANDRWQLGAQRKQNLPKTTAAREVEEMDAPEGVVPVRQEATVDDDDMEEVFSRKEDVNSEAEEEGGYEMEQLETVEIDHADMETVEEEEEEEGEAGPTPGKKSLRPPPETGEEEEEEEEEEELGRAKAGGDRSK